MTYIDPPWNLGNLSSFFTKAYKINTISFLSLIKRILEICKEISPAVNYMEMGKQSISSVRQLIENLGGVVTNQWDTTYYRKHPSHLLRYSFTGIAPVSLDLDGVDDDDTPVFVIAAEQPVSLADLCTGRGLTGRVCYDQGVTFYGTKLNKRRLANLLAFYHNKGLEVKRSG